MSKFAPYMKSIIAALVAGLASLSQALDGDNVVSSQEWVLVAMATLSGLALVFAIPNKDPKAEHQDESVQPAPGRILGKALYSDAEPTVEKPGGMRARPTDTGSES